MLNYQLNLNTRNHMRKLLLLCSFLFVISLQSQDYFPTNTEVKTTFINSAAFKNQPF